MHGIYLHLPSCFPDVVLSSAQGNFIFFTVVINRSKTYHYNEITNVQYKAGLIGPQLLQDSGVNFLSLTIYEYICIVHLLFQS